VHHIYDRVGCTYNAVADYNSINGTFQVCDSDDMTPPGVYTTNGMTTTWTQGPEGVPVSPPYTPSIPQSSNCHTFSSEQLFGAATTTTSSGSSASATGSGSTGGSNASGSGSSRSGSGSSPSQTGNSGALTMHGGVPTLFIAGIVASVAGGMMLVA